jgi:AraC family transcriptional regulator
MPKRSGIENRVPDRYISMRVYSGSQAPIEEMFAPATEFEKWAAVEVTDYGCVPDGLECYRLEGGDYAVFLHRGPARSFPDTMRYIFADWLPRSGFELDAREHFEVRGENWRADDENAEEHLYIPIRKRQGA